MVEINPKRFKLPPFKHQLEGVKALVKYSTFALFDEMRLGKTKQVVDAAGVLFEEGLVKRVIVVCPSNVKTVWTDSEEGEIKKHSWVSSRVFEYHTFRGKAELIPVWANAGAAALEWVVTNYEYLRQEAHLAKLMRLMAANRGNWVVLDESSFIKSHKSQQTKACLKLRGICQRASILNGTPWTHSPLDLWAQMRFLSWRILPFKNYYHFRSRYAVLGGWMNKQVIKFENLDELRESVRPYCLRRKIEDCYDLPPRTASFRTVTLSAKTWKHYVSVRDEFIAWLNSSEPARVASSAAVKSLRLAQLTGGFLGGIEASDGESKNDDEVKTLTLEVGREKLDEILRILEELEGMGRPLIIWCRFVKERERLVSELRQRSVEVYQIYGGQRSLERRASIAAFKFDARSSFKVLVAQPQAGGYGLDLAASYTDIYASSDYNALTRWQSELRSTHLAKKISIAQIDLLAVGPNGQKTIDHSIRAATVKRENLARWTAERWRKELGE